MGIQFYGLGETVLRSTHNVCFVSKIGKIGIHLTIRKWGIRGYTCHGHVFLVRWKSCHVITAFYNMHVSIRIVSIVFVFCEQRANNCKFSQ